MGSSTIIVATGHAFAKGDNITMSGVTERHTGLDSGNILKDAFPFMFKLSFRPKMFVVTGIDTAEFFSGEDMYLSPFEPGRLISSSRIS